MANQLDVANAQFVGYFQGKHNQNVLSLVQGMGLTRKEWEKLKEKFSLATYLSDFEFEQLEEYFKPATGSGN